MTIKNGDLPAVPVYTSGGEMINAYDLQDMITNFNVSYGLTKREMFAMAALQGILSNGVDFTMHEDKDVASAAVIHADNLLVELERTK